MRERRALGVAENGVGDAQRRAEKPVGVGSVPQPAGDRASLRVGAGGVLKYLDQRSDREDARSDRTHGGEGVIPAPLWIVLLLTAAILFVFMLFFAESGERAFVQATMMGGVAVLVSSLLLLL